MRPRSQLSGTGNSPPTTRNCHEYSLMPLSYIVPRMEMIPDL